MRQSSSLGPEFAPTNLRPATHPGGISFHTNFERNPWIVIDLGISRVIGEITIWNREGAAYLLERATPLQLSISEDDSEWRVISTHTAFFRGRRAGRPLVFSYSSGVRGRYVKLTVEKETFFHLDYVEIAQFIPEIQYGEMVDLMMTAAGKVTCKYFYRHDDGLFANFSAILQDVIKISQSMIVCEAIDATDGFRFFKSRDNENVMPTFCEKINGDLISLCDGAFFVADQVHANYRNLPLARIRPIVEAIFPPSLPVTRLMDEMISSSGIVPETTIAIVYRGTDKGRDLQLAPIQDYIAVCRDILAKHPGLDVFIQTDQEQAREAVLSEFPRGKFFNELPVTKGRTVIHGLQFGVDVKMSREEFAQRIMAAAVIPTRLKIDTCPIPAAD